MDERARLERNLVPYDPATPGELRGRARAMTSFLKQGGDKNFGTVPPPVSAPQPGAVTPPVGVPSQP